MSGMFKAMKLAVVATGKSYSILSDATTENKERAVCVCLLMGNKTIEHVANIEIFMVY